MSAPLDTAGTGSRLRELARSARAQGRENAREPASPEAELERCDLCGEPIGPEHRHLLELASRELACACRPCSLLFEGEGAGGGRYRLLPERRLRLEAFAMSDMAWEDLRIPVEMAFFFHSSDAGRVLAYYPGPMGPVESQLELESWRELERENQLLADMEPDVEALLVNRVGGEPRCWLVPLDECYRLIGLIRTRWRGLTGGREVWEAIERYFDELDDRARVARSASRGGAQKGAVT